MSVNGRLAGALLVAATLLAAAPAAHAQEGCNEGMHLGWRAQLRMGNLIVPKNGVPNALRVGGAGGLRLAGLGPIDLAFDATALFGTSDKDGYSYAFGAMVEAQWRPPGVGLGLYVATGAHYFISQGKGGGSEDRSGVSWRGAVGARILLASGWFVGFEPLGIERLPDGPGPYTPLRSRWAWDITWLSLGFAR